MRVPTGGYAESKGSLHPWRARPGRQGGWILSPRVVFREISLKVVNSLKADTLWARLDAGKRNLNVVAAGST